jgi:hypothetical protein
MRVSGAMTMRIGQIQFAHADWGKERLDGHDGAPLIPCPSGDHDFARLFARLDEATASTIFKSVD